MGKPKTDTAKKELTRARAVRDQTVKSIHSIHSMAVKVNNNGALIEDLAVRMDKLENLFKLFQEQQNMILDVLIELNIVDEFSVDSDVTTSTEELYYNTCAIAAKLLSVKPMNSSVLNAPPISTSTSSVLALPKIDLPKYDGNLIQWRPFRDKFVSLIRRNDNLSKIDQFHYLLSCLSGPALSCISSLPLTGSNYDIAWKTLMNRYDNQRLLASAHLDKLFSFRPMVAESLPSLLNFINIFQENVAAITALGVDNLSDFMLFYIGSRLLDPITRQLFEASVSQETIPTFDSLLTFVHHRCRILENTKGPDNDRTEKKHTRLKDYKTTRSSLTTTSTSKKGSNPKCPCCTGEHFVYRCQVFKDLPIQKRRDTALSTKLCFSCLSPSHTAKACKSKWSCSVCKKRHHSLLHQDSISSCVVQGNDPIQSTSQDNITKFSGLSCVTSTVVLGTAIVRMRDCRGDYQTVRVLLDSGSQVSAMTMRCVLKLGLPRRRCQIGIVGLSKKSIDNVKGITSCHFVPWQQHEPSFCSSDIIILPQITNNMPSMPLPPCVRQSYGHLSLADPSFDVPSSIDMLIGGDLLPHIMKPRADILQRQGLPSAVDSFLGWVVFGLLDEQNAFYAHSLSVTSSSLNDMIRSFWSVEEITQSKSPTTEDHQCEKWFLETTTRDDHGRFCVALPFTDTVLSSQNHSKFRKNQAQFPSSMFLQNHGLGESRLLAQKRLFNLESRLNKDPALYAEYQQFMKEYLALGHMKRATQAGKYFIPHHAVVKRDGNKIEKLRVVFDASAATSSGLSLNDVLIAGPKLQVDIFDILVRSRLKRYLLTADITKMYRQILLKPNDCAYQHILWRESPEEEVIEYELRTVTYGVTSAPYLAIRCLHELDAQGGSKFPAAKNILTRQTYVDDIVVGADTEVELSIIQRDIIGLLNSCGCTLKKWTSNCPVILENIDTKDHAKLLSLDPKGEASVKVLGLHWDPSSDHFAYHTSLRAGQYTKRKVLSTIARLFDPIGFLGPTLLWAKIFMQELWKLGLHWDTPLPTHLHCSWDQFVRELPELDSIILPRHIDIRSHTEIQLIGFSDASSNGYAANVYLRVISTSNSINIYFVTCKTKVAPLKAADPHASLSIPRLELCGALLLAQTLNRVKTLLMSEISISRVLAWTDSTVVLSWLTAPQKTFKIFVTNRIAKIHSLLPDCEWAYVNTKENPADPASRGLLPAATVACKIHREGPDFLRFSDAQWPKYDFIPITPEKLPEFQPPSVFISTITSTEPQDDILQRFSSFTRMQRTLAYIRRLAIKARRQPMPDGPLKQEELHHILIHAVLITQARYFPELKGQLIKTDGILRPATIAQLAPFIDPLGVIRVGGRLRYASLDSDAKQPILLPKRSHLTQLIIRHFHQGFLHAGPKLVLSMIRRKFWILSGRDAVRQFIFSCITCVRFKACRPHPIMGNLPSSRVQQNRPFSQVGMDYGGPFLVKESRRRNARTNKMYLALFICMSVKAVHLEIVSDMSSTAFLAAFDRFVARRGIPSNIYTDCGTNYVGAAKQLKALFQDNQTQTNVSKHIPCQWHFNPPAAPHFGGLWEAAIKSVKHHMKHAIGKQILTHEELLTLVTRIEGILNSRPLTPLSSDPNDICALTPGHFLIGQPIMAVPEPDVIPCPMNRLDRWELLHQCHQTFWKRWTREYLTTLQGRLKWYQPTPNLSKGDLVIVEAPNRPPTDWQLGRIIAVHPGEDSIVRAVTIQTRDGVLRRPVVKLVKLPVSDSSIP